MTPRLPSALGGPVRLARRLPGLGGWDTDPLWASVYDWSVEHPRAGGLLWSVALQSDLGRLHEATAEVGRCPTGSRVLDVPCGGGIALRGLRPGQGVRYTAVDIGPGMLDRTRRRAAALGVADQVTTRRADVADLPFDDAAFDLVVSLTGLHCFPDPRQAVAEMTRVLAPGGSLVASAVLNDTGRRYEPLRRGGRLSGLMGPGCTGRELTRWLTAAGLADVTLETSGPVGYLRATRPPSSPSSSSR